MKSNIVRLTTLVLMVSVLLLGCAKEADLPQGIAVGEPNPAGGTSPKLSEEAAKAMQLEKSITGIVSISLKDVEGNVIDRNFSTEDMLEIQTAFNDSFVMDTAYIEMITGYTMTLNLENGDEVFITSYGDENYIVARLGNGQTYHLGCSVIAKILLDAE